MASNDPGWSERELARRGKAEKPSETHGLDKFTEFW